MKYTRGFTLVEVVISIALIGLICYYMYGVIDNTVNSNKIISSYLKNSKNEEKNLDILYDDLFNATDLNLSDNGEYSLVNITTTNTLHNIHQPYVIWLVAKDDNTLIRLESSDKIILPLSYTEEKKPYLDVVSTGIKRFLVYQAKSKKYILIDLKTEKDFYFFEIFKPLGRVQ